jgi:hypothetical protein
LTVAVFLWLVGRFWHPVFGFTAFLQFDSTHQAHAIAAFHEYPVFVHPGFAPYDGMQYSQIAYHPLLRSPELAPAVDNLPYRAQRILLPAVAWLLAAGQAAWIAQVYALLNIVCWVVLAALLWRILAVDDVRGFVAWGGLLFSVGVLGSVRFALIDLPALVLLAAAVWSIERARPRRAVGWLAAAALTRETSLLAAAGLVDRRPGSGPGLIRISLRVLLSAVPLVFWLIYIRWSVGPLNHGVRNFAWPGVGFAEKWVDCLASLRSADSPIFPWSNLLATAGLTVQVAFVLSRPRPSDAWWRVGAAYTLLLLVLGPAVWEGFPGAACRVLLPLNLACNVLAQRTRAPLSWLLACNLTVLAGLVAFKDIPQYPFAATRHGMVAATVEVRQGWFNPEQNSHHRWVWAESRGRLDVSTWPRSAQVEARITVRLLGMTPRIVYARVGDREIWRGSVGQKLTLVELPPLPVTGGHLELEFETDARPVLENARPDARRLGFALYDPMISASEMPSSR